MAGRPFVVLVGGGSASGKTRFARFLRLALGEARAALIQEDAYYLPAALRGPGDTLTYNFDRPETKDFDLLRRHLQAARDGLTFELPHYDFTCHDRTGTTTPVPPADVFILEGMHCLSVEPIRALAHLTVYVEAGAAMRRARRIARDVSERGRDAAETARQFDEVVEPMHAIHVAPTKRHAQRLLVNRGDDIEALRDAAQALAAEIAAAI